MRSEQIRTYERETSAVFLKTTEAYGGLSNMAGGFPLRVNGIRIFSAEALYQACRFPHLPEIQRLILGEASPMTAKMRTRPYRKESRPDWDRVRVRIMRWCLRVKLAQNWKRFGDLLLETGDLPIVEESRKDDFWGAHPMDRQTLVGMNVLGRLLMELREELKGEQRDDLLKVEPLPIPDFLLMDQTIQTVEAYAIDSKRTVAQTSLFDQSLHAVKVQTPPVYANAGIATTGLRAYTDYKDSGLPWLGQVPGHWNVRRIKFLLREVDSRSSSGKEQLLRVSQYTGVTQRKSVDGSDEPDTRAASLVGYKRVCPNDLVINIMLAWNGSLGISKYEGVASPAYCVYRFNNDALPWYYHELLRLPVYKGRIKVASTGVVESRLRLYSEELGRVEAILPPLEEQATIVRFLDHSTHRLDKVIRAKRKTIELLNEQKQAIIHRAVTCGLDSDVPLKDSGIPWLGQIPVRWEVRRVKQISKILRGEIYTSTKK
jgi:type I restriction enzyme S subunit